MVTPMVIRGQAQNEINLLVMSDRTPQGEKFDKLLAEAKIKKKDLAEELGVRPQSIQHWKKRGVSARYASAVAHRLGVDPAEISAVKELMSDHILMHEHSPVLPDTAQILTREQHEAINSKPQDALDTSEYISSAKGKLTDDIEMLLINAYAMLPPEGRKQFSARLLRLIAADLDTGKGG